MKYNLKWLPILSIVVLMFSCAKEEVNSVEGKINTDIEYNSASVKSALKLNNSFQFTDGLLNASFDFFVGEKKAGNRNLDCADISFQDDFWKTPNVITIDFGDGCETPNGDIVAGKMIVSYNKFLNHTGAVRVMHFEIFTLNDEEVIGIQTTENLGRNEDGYYVIEKSLADGHINYDGHICELAYDYTYTFAMSGSPLELEGKNIIIAGDSEGLTPEGDSFTAVINRPLNLSAECHCTNDGKETIVINNQDEFTVDFGDGTCEAIANITYPDNTVEAVDLCE